MPTWTRWHWLTISSVLFGAVVVGLIVNRKFFHSPVPQSPSSERKETLATPFPLAGSASCSARGCHGGIEPVLDAKHAQQNEYTQWTHDPHADAYRVLFNERSQNIVKLLGGDKKAHDDPRCLACHTNPLLASMPQESAFAQQEKLFGVGCESCHGNAKDWLVAHTAADWGQKKRSFTLPDLTDPAVTAKTCAGCHVGAPPDRDVNHDLIAAGHPRLTFEFGAYLANMPPHWRTRKTSAGHLWAVGQIASAQAALELLEHRAKTGPWPEFAEYDCFACHHPLGRQQPERRQGNLVRLSWGTWYYPLTRDLAGKLPALDALEKHMHAFYPDRTQTAARARAALTELKHGPVADAVKGEAHARKRIIERFKSGALSVEPRWDGAEQMYLAMCALSPSLALHELAGERAFAPGYDGPLVLPRNGRAAFEPRRFLEKLKSLPD